MNETRRAFHHELDDIKQELIRLSSEVVERIPRAPRSCSTTTSPQPTR